MKTDWFRELKTEDEKQERWASLLANRTSLDYLVVVLKRKLMELDQFQDSKRNYDSPNWAAQQADYIGCRRTFNEILELVTLEKE